MAISLLRRSVSGDSVSVTVSISGQSVNSNVSGNVVVTSVSGNIVNSNVSGNVVVTSVSGNVVGANVSGNVVVTSISGNAVIFSGQGVWISGSVSTSVSGNIVNTSGQVASISTSGQGVWVSGTVNTSVSGNVIRTIPDSSTTIRTAQGQVCTDASGGTALPSLAADRLTIRMNPDHSGRMFVGSTTSPPTSGFGFVLTPGDGITLQTSNASNIKVFATLSGESIYMIAEDT